MKLSKRLKKIESIVGTGYDHIWDCCCDHGLLGAALLTRQAAAHIHFVDVVPDIMNIVEAKLQRFYPREASANYCQWHTHRQDVGQLPLQQFPGKHLIIIAGVGGDLMIDLIRAICQHNQTTEMDFLLCPVHHQYSLRQALIELDMNLISETLLEENRRFYEILLVQVNSATPALGKVHPVGHAFWQSSAPQQKDVAKRYLQKILAHYRKMSNSNRTDIEEIITAYSAIDLDKN